MGEVLYSRKMALNGELCSLLVYILEYSWISKPLWLSTWWTMSVGVSTRNHESHDL